MIYDISMEINPNIQTYKRDKSKSPVFNQTGTFDKNGVYETTLTIGLHTGTHVDYPLHMIENGKTSNSEVLEKLIGKAKVYDLTSVTDSIGYDDIKDLDIAENDFVLFKTRNSFEEEFNFEFIFVNESAANYLVKQKVRGVGIDSLGIERSQKGHPTHKILLLNDSVIIEGLRLKAIEEGEYNLYCLPLKIANTEASLARVILIK